MEMNGARWMEMNGAKWMEMNGVRWMESDKSAERFQWPFIEIIIGDSSTKCFYEVDKLFSEWTHETGHTLHNRFFGKPHIFGHTFHREPKNGSERPLDNSDF